MIRKLLLAALLVMGASAPALAVEPCSGRVGTLINGGSTPPNCVFESVNADGSTNVYTDGTLDAKTFQVTGAGAGVVPGTPISTVGYRVVDVELVSLTATNISVQASYDNGATYVNVICSPLSNQVTVPSNTIIGTASSYECPTGDHFQLTQTGAGASTTNLNLKKTAFFGTPAVNFNSATTTGITTVIDFSNAVTTTVLAVKPGSGNLYDYDIFNSNAAVCYLQIFNLASGSVVLGTTVPQEAIGINSGAHVNWARIFGSNFSSAISVAAATTRGGAVACTNPLDVNLGFK